MHNPHPNATNSALGGAIVIVLVAVLTQFTNVEVTPVEASALTTIIAAGVLGFGTKTKTKPRKRKKPAPRSVPPA